MTNMCRFYNFVHNNQVMTSCEGSNPIPDLTPIASFDNGLYSSVGSLSGVFLGCIDNGFKVSKH